MPRHVRGKFGVAPVSQRIDLDEAIRVIGFGQRQTGALRRLPDDRLSFLLFPVERPEFFDAVDTDAAGRVREVQVKRPRPVTNWVWGAFKMPGAVLHALHALWDARDRRDEYIGTLVNAWIARGGGAWGVRAGTGYVDVGTLNGYREATQLLGGAAPGPAPERHADRG